MTFSKPSLFSFRNIVLIAFSAFFTRSVGATLNDAIGLQSTELEALPTSIIDVLFQGFDSTGDVDTIPIFAQRSVIEEVLGDNEFIFLAENREPNAQTWLAYLAPEGLSFEQTQLNVSNSLLTLSSSSEVAFDNLSPLELSPAEVDVDIPFEIFFGIDLNNSTTAQIDFATSNSLIPTYTPSDFTAPSNIPEPSSALLTGLALASALLIRKRR